MGATRNAQTWIDLGSSESVRNTRRLVLRTWLIANDQLVEKDATPSVIAPAADKFVEEVRSGRVDLYVSANRMVNHLLEHHTGGQNTARYYRSTLPHYFRTVKLADFEEDEYEDAVKSVKGIIRGAGNLTRENVRTLLIKTPSMKAKALFAFMASTGCRIGEARLTPIKNIDFSKKPARVTFEAEITKTRRERTSFLSSEAAALILDYLKGRKSGYLFPGNELVKGNMVENLDKPLSDVGAWGLAHRALGFAGLLGEKGVNGHFKLHPHTFRSFAEGQMRMQGFNETWIQWLVGHGAGVLEHYRPEEIDNQMAPLWIEKCDPVFCFLSAQPDEKKIIEIVDSEIQKRAKKVGEEMKVENKKVVDDLFAMEKSRPKSSKIEVVDSEDNDRIAALLGEGFEFVPNAPNNGHVFLRRKNAV